MIALCALILVILLSVRLLIPVLQSSNRKLSSFAGWLVAFVPIAILLVIIARPVGHHWWYFQNNLFHKPWLNWSILLSYCLLVPLRGVLDLIKLTRDNAMLFERTRLLDLELAKDLHYQYLADRLELKAIPIHLSPDIKTGYALGAFKKVIYLPHYLVSPAIRGESSFWPTIISQKSLSTDELQPYVAHELAHFRDHAGLRNAIIRIGGMLIPLEFITGEAILYTSLVARGGMVAKVGLLLETLSKCLCAIGNLVWRRLIIEERSRQEWVADTLADEAFPGSGNVLQNMRSTKTTPRFNSFLTSVALLGLTICGFGISSQLLPGRQALPSLLGYAGVLPWSVPTGWGLTDLDVQHPVRFLGLVPRKNDIGPLIRIEYYPTVKKRYSSFLSGLLRFNSSMVVTKGVKLVISWCVNNPGPLHSMVVNGEIQTITTAVSEINNPSKPLEEYYHTDESVNKILQTKTPFRFHFLSEVELPIGDIKNLECRINFFFHTPGTYELEQPEMEIHIPNGLIYTVGHNGSLILKNK